MDRLGKKPCPKPATLDFRARLFATINEIAEAARIAYAFSELRCTFGGRSVVPDIAVLQWKNIPLGRKRRTSRRYINCSRLDN